MSHVHTTQLRQQLQARDDNHEELLSEGGLTAELAHYTSGVPPESTHDEDELYYVVEGAGTLRVGAETYRVESGDVVYVEPGAEHGFVEVDDELTVLVVLAERPTAPSSGNGPAAE